VQSTLAEPVDLERPPPRPQPAASSSSQPSVGAPVPARQRLAPETLHPSLWLGHQLGRRSDSGLPSGFAALDAELPGGGWPRACLTELLQSRAGIGEIRLLAPTLVRAQTRHVMLFDPPMQLAAEVLQSYGLDLDQVLVVSTRSRTLPGTDSLWSLEQTLKSGHVGAVVAWLPPRLRAERVRRLQLAAHNHDGAAFVIREIAVADRPSASPLRLSLRPGGADQLRIDIVKRRGPPKLEPLMLQLPSVLSAAAKRRSDTARLAEPAIGRLSTT
jgi:protein ImuA